MTIAEKQRRRLLRKKAKARRARLLFREYVAKKKAQWDIDIQRAYAESNYNRARA